MSVGKRLAEERKRIGLSQSDFAERVGVSFSSQRRYEDGRSSPDTAYLEAIGKAGVDVGYVLGPSQWTASEKLQWFHDFYKIGRTGELSQIDGHPLAFNGERVAEMLLGLLGVGYESWNGIVDRLIQLDDSGLPLADGNNPAWRSELLQASSFIRRLVEDASLLDTALLTEVIDGIESSLDRQRVSLSPEKKARAIAMLYRTFKASGKVDPAVIEEAVKLAAE